MSRFRTPQAFLEYGPSCAVHPSLWGNDLLFAWGPLQNEGIYIKDRSERSKNRALWCANSNPATSVTPGYRQTSLRGAAFWAAVFNGVTDMVMLAAPPGNTGIAAISTPPLTISFWLKPNGNVANHDGVIAKTSNSYWNDGWGVYWMSPNTLRFFVGSETTYASISNIDLTKWTFFTCSWDGATIRIWADGIEGTPKSHASSATGLTAPLRIGEVAESYWNYNGMMADVRIYGRLLAPAESAILGRHPLAVYEVAIPRYHFVPSGVSFNPAWARHSNIYIPAGARLA